MTLVHGLEAKAPRGRTLAWLRGAFAAVFLAYAIAFLMNATLPVADRAIGFDASQVGEFFFHDVSVAVGAGQVGTGVLALIGTIIIARLGVGRGAAMAWALAGAVFVVLERVGIFLAINLAYSYDGEPWLRAWQALSMTVVPMTALHVSRLIRALDVGGSPTSKGDRAARAAMLVAVVYGLVAAVEAVTTGFSVLGVPVTLIVGYAGPVVCSLLLAIAVWTARKRITPAAP